VVAFLINLRRKLFQLSAFVNQVRQVKIGNVRSKAPFGFDVAAIR